MKEFVEIGNDDEIIGTPSSFEKHFSKYPNNYRTGNGAAVFYVKENTDEALEAESRNGAVEDCVWRKISIAHEERNTSFDRTNTSSLSEKKL